ncbi:MAG TPA: hypothetical protein VKV80_09650 [Streptosporangiaceae bacterium]|nr:hypothetical protein [Streptosporangiaceae bacterium]
MTQNLDAPQAINVTAPNAARIYDRTSARIRDGAAAVSITGQEASIAPASGNGEDPGQREADKLQEQNPAWLIIWGTWTREFVAFPLFHVPPGSFIAHKDPRELARRMRETERRHRRPR